VFDPKWDVADEGDFTIFFRETAVVEKAFLVQPDLGAVFAHWKAKVVVDVFEAKVPDVILNGKNFLKNFLEPLLFSFGGVFSRLEEPLERFQLDVDQIRNVSKNPFVSQQKTISSRIVHGYHSAMLLQIIRVANTALAKLLRKVEFLGRILRLWENLKRRKKPAISEGNKINFFALPLF